MGVGPIPAASVDRWVRENCGDAIDAALFRSCVRRMDAEYLAHRASGDQPSPGDSGAQIPLTPAAFDSMGLGLARRRK